MAGALQMTLLDKVEMRIKLCIAQLLLMRILPSPQRMMLNWNKVRGRLYGATIGERKTTKSVGLYSPVMAGSLAWNVFLIHV